MKFEGELNLPGFDLEAAKRALDAECKQILVEGITVWIEEVETIVPNWSGESRASLRAIGNLVGVPVAAYPVRGAPDRVAKGESEGYAKLETGGFKYLFSWKSDVFHLAYNESNNANAVGFHLINPGPYHSQRIAKAAFDSLTTRRLKSLKFKISTYFKVIREVLR